MRPRLFSSYSPAWYRSLTVMMLLFASFNITYAADKLLSYSFDEGTGTIATNAGIIPEADGSIVGASYVANDRTGSGTALKLAASNGVFFQLGRFRLNGNLTVEAWIKPSTLNQINKPIWSLSGGFSLIFTSGGNILHPQGGDIRVELNIPYEYYPNYGSKYPPALPGDIY
ncbi:hypothetical protein [Methylocucumis oryzae]|uniref:Uncharacterized protein n=1 Tax=Methylocucumis oryzae TaxID=1632867 RepID=A0A0F3IFT0_9GAMM|nr:hypothetical protein [Methylocucumis oryzae]KJV05408.1 hypothetical protein VZ94_18380 [Methylocucumis oryzae]